MNKIFSLILLVGLIGCSQNQFVEDINVAHNSCYSYSYGENGFEQDFDKAFEWCSIAAGENEPSSLTLLAELYLAGNGTEKSVLKARELYLKAAKQGHVHAQLMVFIVTSSYLYETSSDEDKVESLMYLKAASNSGYQKAIEVHNQFFGQKI